MGEEETKKKKFDDKPIEKGGENDCSDGPVKKRGCTDIPCCMIFLAHWGLFCYIVYWAYMNGEPQRLIAPRDYKGAFCGFDGNWAPWLADSSKYDQTKYPLLMYSMNVSALIDDIAYTGVCNSGVYLSYWKAKRLSACGGSLTGCTSTAFTDAEWEARCGSFDLSFDAS